MEDGTTASTKDVATDAGTQTAWDDNNASVMGIPVMLDTAAASQDSSGISFAFSLNNCLGSHLQPCIRQKILNDEYVEFSTLLPSPKNFGGETKVEIKNGEMFIKKQQTSQKISNTEQWTDACDIY